MARKSRRTQRLRVVNPDCAGIDIGKDRHFVAVDPERTEEPVRSFGAFTRDLEEMAAWLASCGVTKVAMESTSVYWIPVYETLERAGFEVMLVPPRMTKQIGGRKSDVLDCQWIWQLMSYGLLRGAFRPGDEVCPLRSYARQMRRLTGDRSRCVLHMQKALTEMNVKLDSVIANIVGLTGQRILRAIIDGERDPERLATLRHRGIKADADTIAASLQGTWREEHLFALEQAMQRYDFLTQQIDDCEARVMAEIERLAPPDDPPDGGAPDPAPGTTSDTASSRSANAASNDTGKEGIQALALRKMMGVDLTAIPTIGPGTALVIASEIGPDFSAFPSAQHFCSWLALAPGTRISGGKNLPGKSPKAVNPVGQALRMAAMAARRSETFIGAKHRARLARMDTPVAIKATARELACLIYLMVTEGQKYVEQGIDAYEKRRLNRKFAHLDRQARKLGLQLVPAPQNDETQNSMPSTRLGICYSRASTCAIADRLAILRESTVYRLPICDGTRAPMNSAAQAVPDPRAGIDAGVTRGAGVTGAGPLYVHDRANGLPDPLGRGLDFAVAQMSVAQGHADIGVPEQPGDHRHRHAVHHRVAGVRVAQVVKPAVLDAGFPPHPIPEPDLTAARTGRVARRRKYEGASFPRLAFENAPGLAVERNLSRPRLAVGQHQRGVMHLRPAQPYDLASSASGQKQEPDHVGLRPGFPSLMVIERPVKAGDFLARQEPGEPGPGIVLDIPRRVGVEKAL